MPVPAAAAIELAEMRRYVETGITRSYEFRKRQLLALREAILRYEEDIYGALLMDLRKSREEAYATELGMVMAEIRLVLKNLRKWTKPEKARTNLLNFPSSSRIYRDPRGVVLIIAPWNYPVQLLLVPLVGAIAGGNAVVLKPSELAPATSALVEKIIRETFQEHYITTVSGDGSRVVPSMMQAFRFDHVFFTGSPAVGSIIYQLAARQMVPVTLELGGKNPAIVEKDASIRVAARRIALGKFLNAGQTCAAPDYVLVHSSIKETFLEALRACIHAFFGNDPARSTSYGRIVSDGRFYKLISYLDEGTIRFGGQHDFEDRYIAPTVMDHIQPGSALLEEEIFGPILPVLTFDDMKGALEMIAANPAPLSFYLFTGNAAIEEAWLKSVPFGGGCVNNTLWHLANHHLPFGGTGFSGIGAYHGKHSFDCFTHAKPVMRTPSWFDPAIKYPPFEGKMKWFKRMIR